MRVSVIIPSWRFDYLSETLKSLENQTIAPHEVLMNYRTTGGIPSIAEKINGLVSIATGDAIIILSDDDMIATTFIEDTTRLMEEMKADIVYTDMARFGEVSDIQSAGDWNATSFRISTVPFITCLIKKSVFEDIGGWDPDQDYADYDFYYRAFKAGLKGYHHDMALFFYRIHHASGSFNMDHSSARAKIIKKHPGIS